MLPGFLPSDPQNKSTEKHPGLFRHQVDAKLPAILGNTFACSLPVTPISNEVDLIALP